MTEFKAGDILVMEKEWYGGNNFGFVGQLAKCVSVTGSTCKIKILAPRNCQQPHRLQNQLPFSAPFTEAKKNYRKV